MELGSDKIDIVVGSLSEMKILCNINKNLIEDAIWEVQCVQS